MVKKTPYGNGGKTGNRGKNSSAGKNGNGGNGQTNGNGWGMNPRKARGGRLPSRRRCTACARGSGV